MRIKYCCDTKAYKNCYLSQLSHGMPYFAGEQVQQGYGLGNLLVPLPKAFFFGEKRCQNSWKTSVAKLVGFASDVLDGKNVKQAAINQPKTAGLNLLKVAQQKIGKRKAATRKVKKKKRKRHHEIFT